MHDALDDTEWTPEEAAFRVCEAQLGRGWTYRVDLAQLVYAPDLVAPSRAWISAYEQRWVIGSKDSLRSLSPLVWVRCASIMGESTLRKRLLEAAHSWNFAHLCAGRVPVVKRKGKGPSLAPYGLEGHGYPVHDFLTMELKRTTGWVVEFKGAGAAATKRKMVSRGRGVESAIENALGRFFLQDERLQEVLPRPSEGPRYQMQNMTRAELFGELRDNYGLEYTESTVVAALPRLVRFPRGAPVHR